MKQEIIPTLKTSDGFRRGHSASELLSNSTRALRVTLKSYSVAFDHAPKSRRARTEQAFKLVRFKTRHRLTHTDRSGHSLHMNDLLLPYWKFQINDRRNKETINLWPDRKQLIIPVNRLEHPYGLLSVFHELGHLHTMDLVESRYWQMYDRANYYYHRNRFPGYKQRQQHQISPNEVLSGSYYPSDEAVRRMPAAYRTMLIDVFRVRRADEQFAWAWAVLTLSRMYQTGFQPEPRMTAGLVRGRIKRKLGTYEKTVVECTSRRLTRVWK